MYITLYHVDWALLPHFHEFMLGNDADGDIYNIYNEEEEEEEASSNYDNDSCDDEKERILGMR